MERRGGRENVRQAWFQVEGEGWRLVFGLTGSFGLRRNGGGQRYPLPGSYPRALGKVPFKGTFPYRPRSHVEGRKVPFRRKYAHIE